MKHARKSLAVATLSAAALLALATPAAQASTPASSSSVQSQIDAQLAQYPGGTQVASNAVEYNGGNVRILFGSAAAAQTTNQNLSTVPGQVTPADTYVHGCPSGTVTKWYCFY